VEVSARYNDSFSIIKDNPSESKQQSILSFAIFYV
jgi:hypothetical protein